MATVIDALLVTLGLDAKGYIEGSKKAQKSLKDTGDEAARVAKDMEARGKQAAQFFSKLRNEALGLLAVFTAGVGIKSFVENTITANSSLGRMSQNLDMSAKDLAMWQLANKNAGGSVEGMTAQLKAQASEVAKAKMGQNTESAQWFYRLGGNPADLRKDVKTALTAKAAIISEIYKKDPIRAGEVAANMGISEDTFNLIKQGPDAIERLRQAQSRLAYEQAKSSVPAEELRKKVDALKNQFEAIGVKILTSLMPQLDRFAQWLSDNQGNIEKWANKVVAAIEQFVKWADSAAQSVGGWKNVLIGLLALKVVSMVAPLISLGAALASVAGGLGAIAAVGGALKILGGLGLLFHSGGLNKGEDETLARMRRGGQGLTRYGVGKVGGDSAAMFKDLEAKYGLPSGLLDEVWRQESGRGKNMLSPKGAKGHFGFMDATAKQYDVKDPNDLAQSADGAARMYRDLLKQYGGNLPMALAGYNWGSGNLAKQGFGAAPTETRNYIDQITRNMGPRAMAGGGSSTSETNITGPINIHTQATDAAGIARDMSTALSKQAFASQANTGLQ